MNRRSWPAPAGERDAAIDFLRAVCILYIVGFWHLVPYTQSFPGYAGVYTEYVKDVALGTFVFCSGLLLAGRTVPLTRAGLAAFYLRRVLRIYPLYALALLGFGVIGMAGKPVIVHALLLVSMFLPPAPYTLWFITMIMVFYLCTPFLLRLSASPRAYLLAGAGLLVLGVLEHRLVHRIDTRILQYLPSFLLGIAWQRMPALQTRVARRTLWLAAVLVAAFLLYRLQHGQELGAALGRVPAILAGTLLLYSAAGRARARLRSAPVAYLAYASFCVYLLHRLVFHYAIAVYFPADGTARLLYLECVVLPVIVLLSFSVQWVYDRGLRL
jgi:peptidoglycan/LPS O-acetylase OafA/YrhL